MKKLVRTKKELNLYNIETIVCDLYGIAHSNNDVSIRFSENEG